MHELGNAFTVNERINGKTTTRTYCCVSIHPSIDILTPTNITLSFAVLWQFLLYFAMGHVGDMHKEFSFWQVREDMASIICPLQLCALHSLFLCLLFIPGNLALVCLLVCCWRRRERDILRFLVCLFTFFSDQGGFYEEWCTNYENL